MPKEHIRSTIMFSGNDGELYSKQVNSDHCPFRTGKDGRECTLVNQRCLYGIGGNNFLPVHCPMKYGNSITVNFEKQ